MAKNNPTVSVILPVYNGGKYLKEAVDSILHQTFSDYECIIVNDGSTDDSEQTINSFNDLRIIYLKNENKQGVTKTIDKAMGMARGYYIVRMDADDISLPDRLEMQVKFMDENPQISISGSWIEYFGSKKATVRFADSVARVHSGMLLNNEIAGSSLIIRKKDLLEKKLVYSEGYRYENEYNFYTQALIAGLKIANIPVVLLKKRLHPSQMSNFFESRVRDVEIMKIKKEYFHFLIKKGYFTKPKHLYSLFTFIQIRASQKIRFAYRQMYLKKKEFDFYRTTFKKCPSINCDTNELKNKKIVDLATVAFHNAEVIEWQIKLLKKNLKDPYLYTVFDNSNDSEKSREIRSVCTREHVAYVKLPENHLTRSSSHGSSLNWVYRNYFKKRHAEYFGFLDHDIFPVKETSLMPVLSRQLLYGHLQERGAVWYLWAGFCFFKSADIVSKLNFLDGKIDGTGVDTGGMNWKPLYSKVQKDKVVFPASWYEKIRELNNSTEELSDISLNNVEHVGDWLHIFSASGWKKMKNQEERDEKIRSIIGSLM